MKKLNYFLRSLFAIILLAVGVNTALAAETVKIIAGTDFTATSANFLDGKIKMTTAQNSSGTAPAYNANNKELRLYYSNTGKGGSVTFALEGIKITQIVIEASTAPTVKYRVDEGDLATAGSWSSNKMTISGIEASKSLMIQNANTTNTQLRIKNFTITYEPIVTSDPTLKANPDELTFKANPGSTTEAQTITLTAANLTSYDINCSWNNPAFEVVQRSVITDTDTHTYTYDVTFTAPAEEGTYEEILTFSAGEVAVDVALIAVVKETVRYKLVKDASTLRVGDQVIIVAANENAALSTEQKSSNREAVGIEKSDNNNYIDITDQAVQMLTLQAGTKENTFAFSTGSGYLYAASSSSNHLKTQETLNDNGSWTISIASGVAAIEAQGNYTRKVMRYNPNNGSPIFSCYAYENNQQDVSLYRRVYTEGIQSEKCYFLVLDNNWTTAAGDYYYAKFINKNTGDYTWVYGAVENTTVVFYLSQYNTLRSGDMPTYTHVVFFKFKSDVELPENLTVADIEAGFDAADTTKSDEIALDATNNIYTIEGGEISTGIESVVAADGIRYAYGVVEAEGAIEVYNVNGTVVARGNDNVDLAGLGRGVYIIRNGNQVRKVVR